MITKYLVLIDKLQTSTRERKIIWEKGRLYNEYKAAIGNNSVSIEYDPSIKGEGTRGSVSLMIWNSKGENIDEIREYVSSYLFDALYNLYHSARRACLKVEDTLDEMISELEYYSNVETIT